SASGLALDDPYEGALPDADVETMRALLREAKVPDDALVQLLKSFRINEGWKSSVGLNCWHVNPYESAAMWKLYASNEEGVAIKSTVRRLKDSLSSYAPDVFLGAVSYIDYGKDLIYRGNPFGNLFCAFLHKRRSFEHEQELRAVCIPQMDPD